MQTQNAVENQTLLMAENAQTNLSKEYPELFKGIVEMVYWGADGYCLDRNFLSFEALKDDLEEETGFENIKEYLKDRLNSWCGNRNWFFNRFFDPSEGDYFYKFLSENREKAIKDFEDYCEENLANNLFLLEDGNSDLSEYEMKVKIFKMDFNGFMFEMFILSLVEELAE